MPKHQTPVPARDWEPFFVAAKVLIEKLNDAKGSHSKTVIMGHFLSPLVGSEVPIQVEGRVGTAKLCVVEGRSKEKRYYFEICWTGDGDESASPDPRSPAKAQSRPVNGRKDSRGASGTKQELGRRTARRRKKTAPAKQPCEERQTATPRRAGNAEKW